LRSSISQTMSTLTHIHGQSTQSGHANAANHDGLLAGMSKNGGLAPYDMLRVVAPGGFSEYVQVRNVDVNPVGDLSVVHAKGTLTGLAAYAGGIGQGKNGAMYRAGGYAVRVSFTANPGNLDEMETDTDGLFSVFVREFAGTVNASNPRVVHAHLHGDDLGYSAAEAYPFPVRAQDGIDTTTPHTNPLTVTADATIQTDDVGLGDTTMFKGDVANVKVMAGMKIKIGDQVRTVVSDITGDREEDEANANGRAATAYFIVDEPFTANDVSETVDNVDYIFYRYQVEQLYDEATYNAVTMSVALYKGTETWQITGAKGLRDGSDSAGYTRITSATHSTSDGGTRYDIACVQANSADALDDSSCLPDTGLLPLQAVTDRYPSGSIMTCRGHTGTGLGANDPINGVITWNTGPTNEGLVHRIDTTNIATNAATTDANAGVCRRYVLMSTLSTGSATDRTAPPLHSHNRANWATVTDQRPLMWSAPDADLATKSRVVHSPSLVSKRGVVGGGSSSITLKLSAASSGTNCAASGFCIKKTIDSTLTFYKDLQVFGHYTSDDSLLLFLGETPNDAMNPTPVTQKGWVTISGCSANSGLNQELLAASFSASTIVGTGTEFAASGVGDGDVVCAGNTVTITTRMATLQDSKAVAIGDRVKFLQDNTAAADPTYETRTVDKVWGTLNDVTMFSVADEYTNTNLLADTLAWVDEAGSTVSTECSGRGICETGAGDCECFKGYTGVACETQNALKG